MIPTRSFIKNSKNKKNTKQPVNQIKNKKSLHTHTHILKSLHHVPQSKSCREKVSSLMCINLRKSFYKGGERCRWLQVFCAQLSRSSKLPPFVPPLQLRASHICIVTFTFSLLRQQKRQFSSKDQSETPSGSQSVNQRNSRLVHIHKPRHNWSQKRNAKLNTCFTTFLPAF